MLSRSFQGLPLPRYFLMEHADGAGGVLLNSAFRPRRDRGFRSALRGSAVGIARPKYLSAGDSSAPRSSALGSP
jgi:hypothetical protein